LHYENADTVKSLIAKLGAAIGRPADAIALIDEKTGKVLDNPDALCEIFQPEGIVYFVFSVGMFFCILHALFCSQSQGEEAGKSLRQNNTFYLSVAIEICSRHELGMA
jgi:hypothetical protein